MSRALSTALALLLLAGLAIPVTANDAVTEVPPKAGSAPEGAEIVPGEVVVKWREGAAAQGVRRARGLSVVSRLALPGAAPTEVLSTAGRPVEEVIAELEADPAVEYAEPNYRVQLADDGFITAVAVNDAKTKDQYSLDRMRVRDAWSITKGASNVVAVLDTGVQADHPDLKGRVLAGYDFVNGDSNAADDNGHGTWVAGIIAANANDGYGVAGISWTDKILPVKIMNSSGTGTTSNLTSGVTWAANNGARVINMSVGGFPYTQYLQDAINYAWNKGAVLVGAAGNNNRDENFYPASYANVVSVSATQVNDEFSHWSSYGSYVDVSAPGSSVLTPNCVASSCPNASWGTHVYISGTSFATPNVAGVVALLMAKNPTWSPSQIVSRLYSTVDDRGYVGWDRRYGRGRVNAYRALGGSVGSLAASAGDSAEPNDAMTSAKLMTLGATSRPSIYPAGDVDWFAVDVPRAGRLDVRVTGVVDTRAYPWHKSGLPVDPIVEIYNTAGTRLLRVDKEWESGTELASVTVTGPTRLFVRVLNYYANGNAAAYSVTPSYVDTAAPVATISHPVPGSVNVSRYVDPVATFNEPVTNVTSATVLLRDTTTNATVPATVTYDAAKRQARLATVSRLEADRTYRFELTTGIKDPAGNALAATSATFTTGSTGFSDTVTSPFAAEIDWLAAEGITAGCTDERFCPTDAVFRDQMASFLARGLKLPQALRDHFTDDGTSGHQENINRIADAKISNGCGPGRYCPKAVVTREQMASFLARALSLPAASKDYFRDDAGSVHEADINRVAQAGITLGCGSGTYCPRATVSREQMAAFLYRALSGNP